MSGAQKGLAQPYAWHAGEASASPNQGNLKAFWNYKPAGVTSMRRARPLSAHMRMMRTIAYGESARSRCWRCSHCSVRMFTNSDEPAAGCHGNTQCKNMKAECNISHTEVTNTTDMPLFCVDRLTGSSVLLPSSSNTKKQNSMRSCKQCREMHHRKSQFLHIRQLQRRVDSTIRRTVRVRTLNRL